MHLHLLPWSAVAKGGMCAAQPQKRDLNRNHADGTGWDRGYAKKVHLLTSIWAVLLDTPLYNDVVFSILAFFTAAGAFLRDTK